MSTFRAPIYHVDGRLRGCWVYFLLCRDDDGPVYVKIGISRRPTARLRELLSGCAVAPQLFGFVALPSRRHALNLEYALHKALCRWRAEGEWFKLSMEERMEFNSIRKSVFALHAKAEWPLRLQYADIQELLRVWERERRQRQRLFKRAAFRDFSRDCRR